MLLDLNPYEQLQLAAGDALIRWAGVEFQLYRAFREQSGIHDLTADSIWGTVVSFDARITMAQRLLARQHPKGQLHDDVVLLLAEVRKRYKQRNEIAHSTPVFGDGGTVPTLAPFLLLSADHRELRIDDLKQRGMAFERLAWSMVWLNLELARTLRPKQPPASPEPPPDLVQELRDEESRRRREQSERQKLLRHALKLAGEGRLPDWPPDQDLDPVVQSTSS